MLAAHCRVILGGILAAFYALVLKATQQPLTPWPGMGWCFAMGAALLWLVTGICSCCESPLALSWSVLHAAGAAFGSAFGEKQSRHSTQGEKVWQDLSQSLGNALPGVALKQHDAMRRHPTEEGGGVREAALTQPNSTFQSECLLLQILHWLRRGAVQPHIGRLW